MISCLTNYIGLQDITDTPTSGRYINEMAGIDTAKFDLVRDSEWYDTEAAWDALERRAIKRFENKISQWANKYFSNHNLIQTYTTGQYDEKSTIGTSANYAGILFDNPYVYTQNVSLLVQSVEIYSITSVTTTIYIFNASTGDTLYSKEVDLVANTVNSIVIGQEYPIWRYPHLFIAYDESEVQTIVSDNTYMGKYVNTSEQRVAKANQVIVGNMNPVNQGLILKYNLSCTLDNFICNRLSLFEEPYMYLLCGEFCNEAVYSDRISRFTLLDREELKQLRDEYLDEFEKATERALKNVSLAYKDDYCFQCDSAVNHRTLLP